MEFATQLFCCGVIEIDQPDDLDAASEFWGLAQGAQPSPGHATAARDYGSKHHFADPPWRPVRQSVLRRRVS